MLGIDNERSVRDAAVGERQLLQEDFRRREVGDMKGNDEDALAEYAELGRTDRSGIADRVGTALKGPETVHPGGRTLDPAIESMTGIGSRASCHTGRRDGSR